MLYYNFINYLIIDLKPSNTDFIIFIIILYSSSGNNFLLNIIEIIVFLYKPFYLFIYINILY